MFKELKETIFKELDLAQWPIPVNLATQEMEIERIIV
jgi:hypothetical protein